MSEELYNCKGPVRVDFAVEKFQQYIIDSVKEKINYNLDDLINEAIDEELENIAVWGIEDDIVWDNGIDATLCEYGPDTNYDVPGMAEKIIREHISIDKIKKLMKL